jgi:2-oxoglutarate ferredoxin oxidoreductase subunit gamma
MVIISKDPIASPVVIEPTTCIVMNRPSFIKFKDRVEKGGMFFINSSLVKDKLPKKDISIFRIPVTDIASELGNIRVANMVMLGAYLKKRGIVSLETALSSLKEIFASKSKKVIELNERALKKGWEEASV